MTVARFNCPECGVEILCNIDAGGLATTAGVEVETRRTCCECAARLRVKLMTTVAVKAVKERRTTIPNGHPGGADGGAVHWAIRRWVSWP